MNTLGIKTLSMENWLEPDEVSKLFVKVTPDGEVQVMKGEDWLQKILEPKLNQVVPSEIQKLFEVARGAMIYGYFFYPLFTLGFEQVFRVAEAAVSHKCEEMKAPTGVNNFHRKIDWLAKQGVILSSDVKKWLSIKESRNFASHPTEQTILPPGLILDILEKVVARINSLYVNGNP